MRAQYATLHQQRRESPHDREEYFKKLGYNCLVVWEHELTKTPETVVASIKNFMEGGIDYKCLPK